MKRESNLRGRTIEKQWLNRAKKSSILPRWVIREQITSAKAHKTNQNWDHKMIVRSIRSETGRQSNKDRWQLRSKRSHLGHSVLVSRILRPCRQGMTTWDLWRQRWNKGQKQRKMSLPNRIRNSRMPKSEKLSEIKMLCNNKTLVKQILSPNGFSVLV